MGLITSYCGSYHYANKKNLLFGADEEADEEVCAYVEFRHYNHGADTGNGKNI